MAVIHRAVLVPSKTDALAAWLPTQAWSGLAAGAEISVAGRFRFDDPAGEVGVETMLVRTADDRVLHAPLTYRGAPLEGAEGSLVTEMEHSVLGRRWVYDATGDPVYADTLRRAIATGGHEAGLESAETGSPVQREGSAVGSGGAADSPTVSTVHADTDAAVTTVTTDHGTLAVLRVVGTGAPAGETLTGTWGSGSSAVLAVLLA